MTKLSTAVIDHITVPIEGERNLLELCRKANIDLPTFCYHSEISVYGACRMCMVEVQGRGIVPACSTPVEPGMVVCTNTKQIREMRKMIVELMLANHNQSCTTCPKSSDCRLREIAKRLGITQVRFKRTENNFPLDLSSDAILRDPNKCVLCGDCVRVCSELQSVGALSFANRGSNARVTTSFNMGLGEVECVKCGQCVKVCPVGALTPKYQINDVWSAIQDPTKYVVVQLAPAVRVALGEEFGYDAGATTTGQIVTALRMMGFNQVYDTCFAADFTVVEEGNEFLKRFTAGENLPQFTSCCPAWVKFAEQYYPEMISNLSTCKSPQQMFGSLCKDKLTRDLNIPREKMVVVSIMPCTAKKFEANREEFRTDGNKDVDFVLTTRELALMIKENGIKFNQLEQSSFDMPFGFKTGASVIFGTSGGVSEAVLRYAASKLCGDTDANLEFAEVRTHDGLNVVEVKVGEATLKLAVVSGLANARQLIDRIRRGEEHFDLVEVMACCGGCVNGGGQPVAEKKGTTRARSKGLYDNDKSYQMRNSKDNPYLKMSYEDDLTPEKAHRLLHTQYKNRRRLSGEEIVMSEGPDTKPLQLNVCFGRSCFLRGAQDLYAELMKYLRAKGLEKSTELKVSFCGEHCKKGPVLTVNGKTLEHCTPQKAIGEIERVLADSRKVPSGS